MQFLSENHVYGCHIFGRFSYLKSNPNQFLIFLAIIIMTIIVIIAVMTRRFQLCHFRIYVAVILQIH